MSKKAAAAPAPEPKRPRGRPTKYTPELAKRICDLLSLGNYFDAACLSAGIEVRTGYRWMKRKDFCQAVEKAQADAETFLLADVRSGKSGWQARAWILERKFPGKFGQRVQASVRFELDQFLDHLQHGLTAEEYRRVIQIAASRFADLEAGPTPLTLPAAGATIDAGGSSTDAARAAAGAVHSRPDGVHPPAEPAPDVPASPGPDGGGDRTV